ncbi:hypothetical protein ACJX0J_030816, partial [Zea mays]
KIAGELSMVLNYLLQVSHYGTICIIEPISSAIEGIGIDFAILMALEGFDEWGLTKIKVDNFTLLQFQRTQPVFLIEPKSYENSINVDRKTIISKFCYVITGKKRIIKLVSPARWAVAWFLAKAVDFGIATPYTFMLFVRIGKEKIL